jgi:hypothetical protein
MDRHAIPRYAHRPNKDGSYDSICSACFATVATVRDEGELARHEHVHVCNPFWASEAGDMPSLLRSSKHTQGSSIKEELIGVTTVTS